MGRPGIRVCEARRDLSFHRVGEREQLRLAASIDRRNNDGHYRPDNCWWIPNSSGGATRARDNARANPSRLPARAARTCARENARWGSALAHRCAINGSRENRACRGDGERAQLHAGSARPVLGASTRTHPIEAVVRLRSMQPKYSHRPYRGRIRRRHSLDCKCAQCRRSLDARRKCNRRTSSSSTRRIIKLARHTPRWPRRIRMRG